MRKNKEGSGKKVKHESVYRKDMKLCYSRIANEKFLCFNAYLKTHTQYHILKYPIQFAQLGTKLYQKLTLNSKLLLWFSDC